MSNHEIHFHNFVKSPTVAADVVNSGESSNTHKSRRLSTVFGKIVGRLSKLLSRSSVKSGIGARPEMRVSTSAPTRPACPAAPAPAPTSPAMTGFENQMKLAETAAGANAAQTAINTSTPAKMSASEMCERLIMTAKGSRAFHTLDSGLSKGAAKRYDALYRKAFTKQFNSVISKNASPADAGTAAMEMAPDLVARKLAGNGRASDAQYLEAMCAKQDNIERTANYLFKVTQNQTMENARKNISAKTGKAA